MPEQNTIHMNINGRNVSTGSTGNKTLLEFLRQDLGLFGARNGCGTGSCGACTVLLNGSPVKSCMMKLSHPKLGDASILTVEGLEDSEGGLHPIQEAFVAAGAVQCGYCTPGMILTAKALLDKNPDPAPEEIRRYIAPRNLCRCTGYTKIIAAIQDAGRVLRDEAPVLEGAPNDASLRRSEAQERVTAQIRYADDLLLENTLFGAVVFAPEAPAILDGVNLEESLAIQGVAGAVTADDIPGSRRIGMVVRDQPALVGIGDRIRSVADPICAVFAETREIAQSAAEAVSLNWSRLPGVYDMDEADTEGSPAVWDETPNNVFYQGALKRGDAAGAMEKSAIVVEGTFNLSRVIHGYMEPESGHAVPGADGSVEVLYPTQTVFDDRDQIADVLGCEKEKVRVRQLPIGGAFGGKEDIIFQHILALGALKFKRPTKITLDRATSLAVVQKKHPARFTARLGLDSEGRFTALTADILTDKGAYACLGFDIVENMMAFVGGPYFIPEVAINGRSVYTNNVMSGAMRGFGANQANFVIESLVEMACEKGRFDAFKLRLKNILRPGLPTITGHRLEPGIPGAEETLRALSNALDVEAPPSAPEGTSLGFGIACGVKNIGFGHGLPESAGAKVVLSNDGGLRLFLTHHEYGQGAVIGEARIASRILGIPLERISVEAPDTERTPFTGATTASRQTFLSGNATLGACRLLRSRLLEAAADTMGVEDPASLRISGDSITTTDGAKNVPIRDFQDHLVAEYREFAPETVGFEEDQTMENGHDNRRTHWAYAYGAQAAWVAVDSETGSISVLKVLTACDVGEPLNPRAIEGQQEGGVVMGAGYALSEEFQLSRGRPVSATLASCGLPRASEAPEIKSITVSIPHPWGPLGVKGFAEAPSLATAPAVAAAVHNAIGVRLTQLPMTKERVKKAIKEKIR